LETSSPVVISELNSVQRIMSLKTMGAKTGLNFINVLHTAFMLVDPKCAKKDSQVSSVIWRFWDLRAQELYVKRWWNWHQVRAYIRLSMHKCTGMPLFTRLKPYFNIRALIFLKFLQLKFWVNHLNMQTKFWFQDFWLWGPHTIPFWIWKV